MKPYYFIFLSAIAISACNNQPKPVSKNIHKTTVTIDGKKDSVINNPQKNYGSATIPDVCTKTLLAVVKSTDSYKKLVAGKVAKQIDYVINWVKAETPADRVNGSKITNGVELVVNEKSGTQKARLGSYIYNNEDATIYYTTTGKYLLLPGVDTTATKKLRNGCYWGVASHK